VSRAQRNSIVLICATAAYYLLWRAADALAIARPAQQMMLDPLLIGVVFVFFWGFALYFVFVGSAAPRVLLATATPLLAGVVLEITHGDAAYPYLALLISGVMAFLAFMGSVLASIGHQWRKRGNGQSVAQPRNRQRHLFSAA
jgi:hypothetical protein